MLAHSVAGRSHQSDLENSKACTPAVQPQGSSSSRARRDLDGLYFHLAKVGDVGLQA